MRYGSLWSVNFHPIFCARSGVEDGVFKRFSKFIGNCLRFFFFFFYQRDKITKFYLVSDMEVFVDNIFFLFQTKTFPRQNKVKNKVPE